MTNIVVTFLINIMKDFIHDLYKERKKETGMKQEQWIKELENSVLSSKGTLMLLHKQIT